jgi:hypothetical protein
MVSFTLVDDSLADGVCMHDGALQLTRPATAEEKDFLFHLFVTSRRAT